MFSKLEVHPQMHTATDELQYNQKVQVQAQKTRNTSHENILCLMRKWHIGDTDCKD